MMLKIMIKRFLAWIGATTMLLAVVGCVKAPELNAISKTNTDQIVEIARAADDTSPIQPADSPLSERIGAQEQLVWEDTFIAGKLTVSINAPVIVPKNDLPIVRVEPANFSQETIDLAYQGLIGDMPMYETVYEHTKPELEELLTYYRSVLTDDAASVADKDFAQEYIQEFEAQLAGAPEDITPLLGTSKLKRMVEIFASGKPLYHDGVDLMSADRKCFFSVTNDRENAEAISFQDTSEDGTVTGGTTIEVLRNASLSYSVMTGGVRQGNGHDTILMDRNDVLPDYTDGLVKMTPAEAAAQVDDILTRMGISSIFGISEIYLCSDYHPGWNVPKPTGYYYDIRCTRSLGGALCASVGGSGTRGKDYWGSECIDIQMDDFGISLVAWTAPMSILETIRESTPLRPYAEIIEIAQKILPIKFESEAREENVQSVKVKIDRVTLSL